MNKDTEVRALDLILERGVQFELPTPLWLRLFHPYRYTIKPLKAGTILMIKRLLLDAELEDIEVQARCIAMAILNDKKALSKPRKIDKLTKRLLSLSSASLIDLFLVVQSLCRDKDFTSITIWLQSVAMMMGRKMEGS